ncbi:MAG TPA: type II toxin-antitoxin system PemK/MazF family toxin [Phycisphaerae bacterium]
MKRGEVWMVDFGTPSGPERARQRPAIVLQDDALTAALTTVIVLPLTTNLKRLALPTTVLVRAGEAGLPRDSVVLCHQVQVRGKARLLSRIGELAPDRLAEVQDRLLDTLGL